MLKLVVRVKFTIM